jgi:holo-[acyl-carrier protein] synthase
MTFRTDPKVNGAVQPSFGVIALVSLTKLGIHTGLECGAQNLLMGSEIALWQRLQTERRRLEFLGGRLAAKLAVNRLQSSIETPYFLHNIEVMRSDGGKPYICSMKGIPPQVSISHTRKWAVALAVPGHICCGIDIEDCTSRVRLSNDYFHETEIEVAYMISPRRHWVLKEAIAKLSGRGFQGDPHSVKLFMARSFPCITTRLCQLPAHAYSGVCSSLVIGIALRRAHGDR